MEDKDENSDDRTTYVRSTTNGESIRVERTLIDGVEVISVSVPIGFLDLTTRKATLHRPELQQWFEEAIAEWRERGDPSPSAGFEHSSPAPSWHDLAKNRPGQAARAKADEIRSATPPARFRRRAVHWPTEEERLWSKGATGEELVGSRLNELAEGWYALHSIPVVKNDSDIDHLVIGPTGVYALNTKNHDGQNVWIAEQAFMVNGQKTNHLRNSRFEAQRASKLLSKVCGFPVSVEPVLVVIAEKVNLKAQPDVHIVGGRDILRWLSARPWSLTPHEVESIFEKARRSDTWSQRPFELVAPAKSVGAERESELVPQAVHVRPRWKQKRWWAALAFGVLVVVGALVPEKPTPIQTPNSTDTLTFTAPETSSTTEPLTNSELEAQIPAACKREPGYSRACVRGLAPALALQLGLGDGPTTFVDEKGRTIIGDPTATNPPARPDLLQTLNIPPYRVLARREVLIAPVGFDVDIVIPSLAIADDPVHLELICRSAIALERANRGSCYRTESAIRAKDSAVYARKHPGAFEAGHLGRLELDRWTPSDVFVVQRDKTTTAR